MRVPAFLVLVLVMTTPAHLSAAETPTTTTRPQQLPDPFLFADGRRVASRADWDARRKELLDLILEHEYGHLPPPPKQSTYLMLISHRYRPLMARHEQYRVTCDLGDGRPAVGFVIDLLYPDGEGPFPVILRGDWCWGKAPEIVARQILDRGYILAEFNRCELAPDRSNAPVGLFEAYRDQDRKFGAVAAWAWGYHRAVDFLTAQGEVDKERIAITGHSRGGKAVLLAGATDQRIALTAPNNSGTGGAASFRFQTAQSEPLRNIVKNFPTWFSPRLNEFVDREDALPFDQHSLKACVAPRALLTTEALADLHANPSGTWLTHRAAREVYRFLGAPARIAIHFRPGSHEHRADDFATLLDYADEVFFKKGGPKPRDWDPDQFPELPPSHSWKAPATQRTP